VDNGVITRMYALEISGGGLTLHMFRDDQACGAGVVTMTKVLPETYCHQQNDINFGAGFMSWRLKFLL
jgi:hypothetical protein